MKRFIVRLLAAAALVLAGWTVGRAQALGPDFEIVVDAPEGKTNITCVRGCQLAWVERMVPETVKPNSATFSYGCNNSQGQRCASGRIGGWIVR